MDEETRAKAIKGQAVQARAWVGSRVDGWVKAFDQSGSKGWG